MTPNPKKDAVAIRSGEGPMARRIFLQQVTAGAGAVGARTLLGTATLATAAVTVEARAAPSASALQPSAYLSLGPDEAAFVERLVNVMCPADELTPAGVDCGLATYIDRQLSGAFGRGDRLYRSGPWAPGKPQLGFQLPLSPEEFFKAGIAETDVLSRKRFGAPFAQLSDAHADGLLQDISSGTASPGALPLAQWFNELVYPLFVQACFADPAYGGNRNKVFWKAIGFPGLPAFHAQNMVAYRGKPFPGAKNPQSMQDFL
jgi:gluconate 2-dehydrogenase gamma chain